MSCSPLLSVRLQAGDPAHDLVGRRLVHAAVDVGPGVDAEHVARRRDRDSRWILAEIGGEGIGDQQPGVVDRGVLGVELLALVLDVGRSSRRPAGTAVEDREPVTHQLAMVDERLLDGGPGLPGTATRLISSMFCSCTGRSGRPVRCCRRRGRCCHRWSRWRRHPAPAPGAAARARCARPAGRRPAASGPTRTRFGVRRARREILDPDVERGSFGTVVPPAFRAVGGADDLLDVVAVPGVQGEAAEGLEVDHLAVPGRDGRVGLAQQADGEPELQ